MPNRTAVVDFILGAPIATDKENDECVGPLRGVSILGLDALASAAYGPEALLAVLLPLGVGAVAHVGWITLLIVGLLSIVFLSYRQTISAYPNGGGSYTVAKENLGRTASVVAAAALALDYMLNVSVAISAGVGALVSAVPALLPETVPLGLGTLLVLMLVNLRGVRAAGAAFLAPTYVFVGTLLAVLGLAIFRTVTHGGHPVPVLLPPPPVPVTEGVSLWLLTRAFANGCTAMTGVEAVSNGVPIFHEPRTRGARRTLAIIVGTLAILLMGVAFGCRKFHIMATPPGQAGYQSVLSQLTAAVVGRGWFYGVTMGAVIAVLALSANTSFAGFPRLCRVLALDGFLPEKFAHRGRRLAYSNGILVLSAFSGILLLAFGGITDALIPLFALGAFVAFTMSQAGMVQHWRKLGGHRGKMAINAVGAVGTGVTSIVIAASKFVEGAWVSVLILLGLVALLLGIHRHSQFVAQAIQTDATLPPEMPRPPIAVVPLRTWSAVSLKALEFAVGFSHEVIAVQVLTRDRQEDDLTDRWPQLVEGPVRTLGLASPPRLVVLPSEYRRLYAPLLDHVAALAKEHPDRQIAVVLPELVVSRWRDFFLHGHKATVLRELLLLRGGPQVVVVTTPFHLRDWEPERRLLGVKIAAHV